MKTILRSVFLLLCISCNSDVSEIITYENPQISLNIPYNFPPLNNAVSTNTPTQYGVELGKKLFFEKKLSADNSISCASCHVPAHAFTDKQEQAVGIENRVGIRNTPPIQNLAFMNFYNWDGNKLVLENQPLVPIITFEEMDSSILEVIEKIAQDETYVALFNKTFNGEGVTADGIYKSIAQYQYTLISSNSKYDKVKRNEGEEFTESEFKGYQIFKEKCISCHSTELFTDQSFRNIGFPINPSSNEGGRARVTGVDNDYMSFRVPSLRNIELTAPYGSFGQFKTLQAVLDYFDNGVIESDNLDPIFKENNNRIPLTEDEKNNLIAFLKTLSDTSYVNTN